MSTTAPQYVVYTRVSTDEQSDSRLGLEAQLAACRAHVEHNGGEVLRVFEECDSGGNDEREQFKLAVRLAKRAGATLVCSKLDRIARSVLAIAQLVKDNVALRIVEIPNADTTTVYIHAVLAERERENGRQRTRDALHALKARGVKLGSARPGHWKGREHLRLAGLQKARAARKTKVASRNADLYAEARPIVEQMQGESLRAIGSALEAAGVFTPRGSSKWTPTGVKRLRDALAAAV